MSNHPDLRLAVCQNFLPEVVALQERGELADVEVISWTPTCEHPAQSWEEVAALFPEYDQTTPLLIIGSCFPKALKQPPAGFSNLHLQHIENCFDLLCASEQVADLIKQRAYLTSTGWLKKWRPQLDRWGFDQPIAQRFFQEAADKIVLLDSGINKAVLEDLAAFADYVGLPSQQLRVGLDFISFRLKALLQSLKIDHLQNKLSVNQEQTANYALSLSLLDELTNKQTEPAVTAGLMDICRTLFAPQNIHFYPSFSLEKQNSGSEILPMELQRKLEKESYLLHESDDGFWLLLKNAGVPLGYLNIVRIAFPKYLNRYLNLALAIAPLCALSINKARISEQREKDMVALVHLTDALTEKNQALLLAQAQIKTLAGIIPICSYCKGIRDDKGYWNKLEQFIENHSDAQFSHGICDACMEQKFGEYKTRREQRNENKNG